MLPLWLLIAFIFVNLPDNLVHDQIHFGTENRIDILTKVLSKELSANQYSLGFGKGKKSSRTMEYVYFPVSRENSLGTYAPDDLVVIGLPYATRSVAVSNLIVSDLKKMITAASKDGVDLKVVSAYRSYSEQVTIFNSYVENELRSANISREEAIRRANQYSAMPGHSEHQLGTTVDILSNETNYSFTITDNLRYVKWLEENSEKYNFSISFPKNNTEYIYEPWHVRWRP